MRRQHFGQFRIVNVDPVEQTSTREVRLQKWLNGELVAAEEHILHGNMYFEHELLLMLTLTRSAQSR